MHTDYDFARERQIHWLHPWGRHLSYLIERFQQKTDSVRVADSEVLIAWAWDGKDFVRTFSVKKHDGPCDGIRPPTCALFGTLIDPLSIYPGRQSARYQRRRVGLITRWQRGKALGRKWWRRFRCST